MTCNLSFLPKCNGVFPLQSLWFTDPPYEIRSFTSNYNIASKSVMCVCVCVRGGGVGCGGEQSTVSVFRGEGGGRNKDGGNKVLVDRKGRLV